MTNEQLKTLATWYRAEVQMTKAIKCHKKAAAHIASIVIPMDENDRIELFYYLNKEQLHV